MHCFKFAHFFQKKLLIYYRLKEVCMIKPAWSECASAASASCSFARSLSRSGINFGLKIPWKKDIELYSRYLRRQQLERASDKVHITVHDGDQCLSNNYFEFFLIPSILNLLSTSSFFWRKWYCPLLKIERRALSESIDDWWNCSRVQKGVLDLRWARRARIVAEWMISSSIFG